MDAGPYDPAMATRSTAIRPSKAGAAAAPAVSDAASPQRVLRQFRVVFNSVKTHFQQMEKHAGLGGAQVWALSIVRERPDIGVSELARALDVKQPTASNLVRTLAEQDLLEVRRDTRDGRAVKLRLRPAGARVLKRTPGPFAGVLPEALATLDAHTLARLETDLTALIQALKADERAAKRLLSQM